MTMIRPFGSKMGEGISTPIDKERAKKVAVIGGLAVVAAGALMLAEKLGIAGGGEVVSESVVDGKALKLSVTAMPSAVRAGDAVGIAVKLDLAASLPNSQVVVKFNLPDDTKQDGYSISNQTSVVKTSTFGTSISLTPGTYSASVQVLSDNKIVANSTADVVILAPTSAPVETGGSDYVSDPSGGGSGEANTTLPAPTNLTPDFVMVNWVDPIKVKWTNPPGTKFVRFELQSPTSDEGFTLVLKAAQEYNIRLPRIGAGPYIILPSSDYVWTVAASNAQSEPLQNSSSFGPSARSSFTTPPAKSSGIGPVSPINGKTGVPTTGYVQWADTNPYIFYYDIQISSSPEFGGSVISERKHAGETNPRYSCAYSNLAPGTKHYWRVRPVSPNDNTGWSAVWSFTTAATSTTDTSGGTTGGTSGGTTNTPAVQASLTGLTASPKPGERITGTLKLKNTSSGPLVYDVSLYWQNNNDQSGNFSRSVNVSAGQTYNCPFDVKAPNTPGTYRAYMGIRAGSVVLDSDDGPEDSSWNVVVSTVAAAQAQVPVSGSLSISKSGNSITYSVGSVQGNPDGYEVYAADRSSNTVNGGGWTLVGSDSSGSFNPANYRLQGPYIAVAVSLIKGGGVAATGVSGQAGNNPALAKVISYSVAVAPATIFAGWAIDMNGTVARVSLAKLMGASSAIVWANKAAAVPTNASWTRIGTLTPGGNITFDTKPYYPGNVYVMLQLVDDAGKIVATGAPGVAGYKPDLGNYINEVSSARRLDGIVFL